MLQKIFHLNGTFSYPHSQILSYAWLRLLLKLSIAHFISSSVFLISRICLVLFYDFYFFVELLVLFMHSFPEFIDLSICILFNLSELP